MQMWAAVSDMGIAYTMCTEHFLHSQDGLSSIDTYIQDVFQHRLNSNLPQAGNCDLYG